VKSIYHPEFPKDIVRFAEVYEKLSPGLGARFRTSVDEGIELIKASPESAGHFVNTGSAIIRTVRRRNLKVFSFFIVYGVSGDSIIFGAVIPSKSDPINWLERFIGKTT